MTQADTYMTGIVADDLTSATDAAMAFLSRGDQPLIQCGSHNMPEGRVVAVDTDSRAASESAAAERTGHAIRALAQRPILMKTVDSTLRGHARAEIAAAFHASGRKRLVLAPAFPAAGRVTRDGVQLVHGVPVDRSPYASDPVHPARTARLADLIDPALGQSLILRPDTPDTGEARVLILDAATQSDLNHQVARLADPSATLWVGSPGLALALAALTPQATHGAGPPTLARRLLIVAGSANPVTHAQCDQLVAAGIQMGADLAEMRAGTGAICLAMPRGWVPEAPLAQLTDQAAVALAQGTFDGVIATGGETMAAILQRLGVTEFHLTQELEPGFPAGLAQIAGRPLVLAMKAGGFGTEQTLLRATQALTGGKETDHD